ncbi:MAG: trehalose-6-phosphate synthase, partial [Dehalococcoidia bacterium]|nr:trehalose-6-phosphate synthase [Dehalococcoidia bacterium]
LVTALEPVMCACGGTWIAQASGNADRELVDEYGRIAVPPQASNYWLKRVWLTKDEEEGFYYGFANQALWPLCHLAYARPRFDPEHWKTYKDVNWKFAQAVLEEAGSDPAIVFIQDYHFALLPKLLKQERPDLSIALFWHIPWPNPQAFATCPYGGELLEGLLGNDLLGFQTPSHCSNFMRSVDGALENIVDYEHLTVTHQGDRTLVRPFPVGVDCEALSRYARSPEAVEHADRLRHELGLCDKIIGLGVDRIDYTKGIPERFLAIDRFLGKYPEYKKWFTFLQIGPVSRINISEYKALNDELYHLMIDINHKHGEDQWTPIQIVKGNHPRQTLVAYFLLADVCIVSSLDDGMNLVAKEFVSARPDGNASLILSRFAGAAKELSDAVLINPYDTDGFADAIKYALAMPAEEKERRMARMWQAVAENNTYSWAARVITEIGRLT